MQEFGIKRRKNRLSLRTMSALLCSAVGLAACAEVPLPDPLSCKPDVRIKGMMACVSYTENMRTVRFVNPETKVIFSIVKQSCSGPNDLNVETEEAKELHTTWTPFSLLNCSRFIVSRHEPNTLNEFIPDMAVPKPKLVSLINE